jgi:hypothetical protein
MMANDAEQLVKKVHYLTCPEIASGMKTWRKLVG